MRTAPVRKTPQMRVLELEDARGREIRQILADAYREAGNVVGAGRLLGISHGAFVNWVQVLGGEIRSEVIFSETGSEVAA